MRVKDLLSLRDVQRLLDLIDACYAPLPDDPLRQQIHARLREILPHGAFAHGRVEPSSGSIDFYVNKDFPPEYLASATRADGTIACPLVRRWVRTRAPVYYEYPRGRAAWSTGQREAFEDFGLRGIALHCVPNPDGATSCYALARLDDGWSPRSAALLRILTPHLHLGLARARPRPTATDSATLTRGELKVLGWVFLGKSNKEIGLLLGVSPWTVKNQVQSILHKLGAANRAHAVARSISMGLFQPPE